MGVFNVMNRGAIRSLWQAIAFTFVGSTMVIAKAQGESSDFTVDIKVVNTSILPYEPVVVMVKVSNQSERDHHEPEPYFRIARMDDKTLFDFGIPKQFGHLCGRSPLLRHGDYMTRFHIVHGFSWERSTVRGVETQEFAKPGEYHLSAFVAHYDGVSIKETVSSSVTIVVREPKDEKERRSVEWFRQKPLTAALLGMSLWTEKTDSLTGTTPELHTTVAVEWDKYVSAIQVSRPEVIQSGTSYNHNVEARRYEEERRKQLEALEAIDEAYPASKLAALNRQASLYHVNLTNIDPLTKVCGQIDRFDHGRFSELSDHHLRRIAHYFYLREGRTHPSMRK